MDETITSYRSKSPQMAIETVDFSTVAGKRFAFFTLTDPSRSEEVMRLLGAEPLFQSLVVSTHVAGKAVLVMQGEASPTSVLDTLAKTGSAFEKVTPSKGLEPWKIRSILGFSGQALQLTSTFLRAGLAHKAGKGFWKNVDPSIFVFSASNLAANSINLIYPQGEQVEDVHQQRYLKQRLNRELAPHLKEGETTLDIDDHRRALRPDHESHKPIDEAKGFLKRHSVRVGELGLRYLGALGLAFPATPVTGFPKTGWKTAWNNKTMPARNPAELRAYAGLSSIFGKTVSLTSAIPDPYNPKPATWLDHLREKVAFLGGGLIEITSFSALAYDCFFNTKRKPSGLVINGKPHRDWLGGIGASMFVLGYIVRSWAKFGERNVDMKELYAHASDTLAATSPEKIPQLLANTAASLTEHFQDKPGLNFATIYSNLANDLTTFHTHSKKPTILMASNENSKQSLKKPLEEALANAPALQVIANGAQVTPLVAQAGLAIH